MDHCAKGLLKLVPPPSIDKLDFSRRWTGSELMDDPDCDETLLLRTVDQFASLNRLVSRYRTLLSRLVLDDMAREPDRSCHLVDLGAGGCDIPVWLLREAARRKVPLKVTALDGDARIVRHARSRHGGVKGLSIHHADLSELERFGPVDYVFSNHVLHHLPDEAIPGMLRMMSRAALRRWMVSDLHRSRWPYLGFQLLGRCYRRSFAFEDGKRSIRRGFVTREMHEYARAAGLKNHYSVKLMLPGRIVMYGNVTGMAG